MDFSSLTDVELREMLVDHGIECGPINGFTRRTYERKLQNMKTGRAPAPTQNYEPAEDDEDNEVQFKRSIYHTPRPENTPQPRMRKEAPLNSYLGTPRVESRPPLNSARKTTTTGTPRPQPQPSPAQGEEEEKSGGLASWLKVFALLVVVVLVYLIYSNMEPQAVSKIPSISNDIEI